MQGKTVRNHSITRGTECHQYHAKSAEKEDINSMGEILFIVFVIIIISLILYKMPINVQVTEPPHKEAYTNPPEIENLCKTLFIPTNSEINTVISTYEIMKCKWEPSKYIHDPDKYFQAKQIYDNIISAYLYAENILHDARMSNPHLFNIVNKATNGRPSLTKLLIVSIPIGIILTLILMALLFTSSFGTLMLTVLIANVLAFGFVYMNYKDRMLKAWVTSCLGCNLGSSIVFIIYGYIVGKFL